MQKIRDERDLVRLMNMHNRYALVLIKNPDSVMVRNELERIDAKLFPNIKNSHRRWHADDNKITKLITRLV